MPQAANPLSSMLRIISSSKAAQHTPCFVASHPALPSAGYRGSSARAQPSWTPQPPPLSAPFPCFVLVRAFAHRNRASSRIEIERLRASLSRIEIERLRASLSRIEIERLRASLSRIEIERLRASPRRDARLQPPFAWLRVDGICSFCWLRVDVIYSFYWLRVDVIYSFRTIRRDARLHRQAIRHRAYI